MAFSSLVRAATVLAATAAVLVLQSACARAVDDGFAEGILIDGDSTTLVQDMCVDTICPGPLATCAGAPPCTIDLQSDVMHCGACENPCPKAGFTTHGTYLCSAGKCVIACDELRADCNGNAADGCEVKTGSDPKNCGGCGVTCKDGDPCWKGACGCPKGFANCDGECKNLQSDDDNCSACGKECRAPTDDADPRWKCGPKVQPRNTKWTCATAECAMHCKPGYQDCNNDFCGDGCETNILTDMDNCGACGNKCAPGQECMNGACMCPAGTVNCGDGTCTDVNVDPNNCGYCGNECPGAGATRPGQKSTGAPGCVGGKCTYECYPGYADCDGDQDNGCEAKLDSDQKNCGACGKSCDVGAGQPCVSGHCLVKKCVPGIVR